MLRQIKKLISKSPILQVTSFISFGLIIKIASGFVVSKLSAVFLGTKGLAIIGNLRNALLVLQNISTIGLNKAVVKYSSEYKDNSEDFKVFISTLMWLLLLISLLIFGFVFFFSEQLSLYVFEDKAYSFIFKLMAVLLPIYALNTFLIAVLQGFEKFKKVVRINIYIHLLNVVLFSYSIYKFGLNGALTAIVVVPSASLIITLFLANKEIQFWHYFDINVFSKKQLKYFGQYALMTLISAVSFPLVYLSIRQTIADSIDIDAAGYWEACFRLSTIYLLLIQYLLNLYILPKLVQAKNELEFRAIIFDYYKQILPLFAFGLLIIFILRDYIIWLVFSEEFMPVSNILGWQIIADIFRVMALVLTYQFHAKKMIWHYILTDLFLALSLYLSALYGLEYYDLEGVVLGHALTYFVYFALILFIFRNSLFRIKKSEN
jgi:PST family polysaccharide transporter